MTTNALKNNKDIILIGASTGGPNAIEKIVSEFEKDLNAAVLIVQHMPSGFTKTFAERLNRRCQLEVLEASDGIKIEKNKVYIAPGGYHMIVRYKGIIEINKEEPIWGVRPSVDKLFMSIAPIYKNRIISVILTGMGRDGSEGTVVVKMNNGTTIAQDENSSVIYGMPKSAYETGYIDYVLPLKDIASKIKSLIKVS